METLDLLLAAVSKGLWVNLVTEEVIDDDELRRRVARGTLRNNQISSRPDIMPIFGTLKDLNATMMEILPHVEKHLSGKTCGLCVATPTKGEREIVVTTQCVKVKAMRKAAREAGLQMNDRDIHLEWWMSQPNNLYVGRDGRIFIHDVVGEKPRYFRHHMSKWHNPNKVKKGDNLEENLRIYREHILNGPLKAQLGELVGKNLGCFCDQSGGCHAKVLAELVREFA